MSFTQRPRTLAIAAVTVMFITAALTLFLLPPGSLDTQHHYVVGEMMHEHLATIDQRLQELELHSEAPMACPTTWVDTIKQGRTAYELRAEILFAHFDPLRNDWVPTCNEQAGYYAIRVEGSWRGAIVPRILELASNRYAHMALAPVPYPEDSNRPLNTSPQNRLEASETAETQ